MKKVNLTGSFGTHLMSREKPVHGFVVLMMAVAAAFFPWVSFKLNSLDTQPWFLILAGAYLLLTLTRLQRRHAEIWFFMFGALGVLLALHEGDVIHTVRGISTYIAAGFSIILFERYMRVDSNIRLRMLIFVNSCWLLYPVLQFAGLSEMIPLVVSRTSESRGFTSLAPEPTFYGVFSLSMIAILILERGLWRRNFGMMPKSFGYLIWINIFQIFLVAQSSMAILLFLIISFIGMSLYRTKIMLSFLGAALLILIFVNTTGFVDLNNYNSRPLQLLSKTLNEPSSIVKTDQSINERVSAVYISVSESIDDFLLPHGLFSFTSASMEYVSSSTFVNRTHGNKIMSFVGGFLFELGIISLLYFFVLGRALVNIPGLRGKIFWFIAIGCVLLTAIPVGFPLVGYVVALLDENRVARESRSINKSFYLNLHPHRA